MNDDAALNKRIKDEEDAVKIWERAGKCICCYQQQQEEHRQLANWLKELRRLRTEKRDGAKDGQVHCND